MIERGPTTEDEMVVAFLRAEVDSSRYGDAIRDWLEWKGLKRNLIDAPNLGDSMDSESRKELLTAYRGYGNRKLLFTGFPLDVRWRRVVLEPDDLPKLRYANYSTWVGLSGGSRLVIDGARNFPESRDHPETYQIKGIMEAVRNGAQFPELIAVEAEDASLILVEGHSRATAYVIEQAVDDLELLVGSSPLISKWSFY